MAVLDLESYVASYVGKNITQICQNYTKQNANHCAHFVCHVLGLSFDRTCQIEGGDHGSPAANIRVQELFPKCPEVGMWDKRPPALNTCLIFVTMKNEPIDFVRKIYPNVGNKHVGIFINGFIYHYSNDLGKQVMKQTMPQFEAHMITHYKAIQKAYGRFPI